MREQIERLVEGAAAAELVDVAYARVESPYGELLVAATPRGVVRVSLPNFDPEQALVELAARVSPRVLEAPASLDPVRRQLDAYFEGRLTEFDVELDWRLSGGFLGTAQRAIATIGYGETDSYAGLARRAGNERAVRAAGTACATNPLPIIVPCHRVLRSDGSVGNYGGGPEMKRGLLGLEGSLP